MIYTQLNALLIQFIVYSIYCNKWDSIYGIVHFWKTTFCNHNILVLNISGDWLIFQIVPGTGGSKDYRLLQNILLLVFCWFVDLSTSNVFQIEII